MGLFNILFGDKKTSNDTPEGVVNNVLNTIFKIGGLDLKHQVDYDKSSGRLTVDVFGDDEELLRAKEGQLLDSFQLFLKRTLQHQFKDLRISVIVDNEGFRDESNQSLIELAEKLKGIVLDKGKPVYFRALPPRDRKVIHQYLAEDERVKSRSIGDGLYKKIKIYPIGKKSSSAESSDAASV